MDNTTNQTYREIRAFDRVFQLVSTFSEYRFFKLFTKVDFETDKATGCWRWSAGTNEKGYGIIHDGTRRWIAHRLSWAMLRGPIPPDIHLHHLVEEPTKCIGPACINPDHLQPVTPEEHVTLNPDNITMQRKLSNFCARGHLLSADNVYIIPKNGTRRCKTCRAQWETRRSRVLRDVAKRPEPAHCRYGHVLDEDNTYLYLGARICKKCHNDLTLRRYHEKRVDVNACTQGHPYTEYGGVTKDGRRFCRECIRLRDERIRESKVVDGIQCCKHGHPRTPENTYLQKGTNRPLCRVCLRESQNKAYAKRKMKYDTQSN